MNKRGISRIWTVNFFVILFIILGIIFLVYVIFFNFDRCLNFQCFKSEMERCNKVSYINEESDASWKYNIKGVRGDKCEIEIKLLLVKKGELQMENLEGYEMNCFYPKGVGEYPEDDLRLCHGRLKEELQQIIINKLHSYIVENLGKIDEKINTF